MNDKNAKVVELLLKLIRHERSAREIGNLQEAEAFAVKIQALLTKHNLSLSEIDIEEAKASVGYSDENFAATKQWHKFFAHNLAKLHGCEAVFSRNRVQIAGTEFDRAVVAEIYQYFVELGEHLSSLALREWKKTPAYTRKRKRSFYSKNYKNSYGLGYQQTLTKRMREQLEQDLQNESDSTALVYIGNRLAETQAFIGPRTRQRQMKTKNVETSAFQKGRQAGNDVSLSTKAIGS